MSLLIVGVSHHSSPAEVRNLFAFTEDKTVIYGKQLLDFPEIQEALVLSTCNRTELCVAFDPNINDVEKLVKQLQIWWQNKVRSFSSGISKYCHVKHQLEAARYLIQVACGLDSMVIGEAEILGQLKKAYANACQAQTLGHELSQLFQHTFATAKQIRNQTRIGFCPVSMASSAVQLVKEDLLTVKQRNILLIGAGQTARLVGKHIQSLKPSVLKIINRTYANAAGLADELNGEAYPMDKLQTHCEKADIVIAAVSSNEPLVHLSRFKSDQKQLFIDLSMPNVICDDRRNSSANLRLYSIDDVDKVIESNVKHREQASYKANQIIENAVHAFNKMMNEARASGTIRQIRHHTDQMMDQEIDKALRRLANGENSSDVLMHFAHNVKNKWLHAPSVKMREASSHGREDLLGAAQELFGVSEVKH